MSDRQGNLDDLQRIYYYKHYINQATILICSNPTFYRTQVYLGSDLWVRVSLTTYVYLVQT